MKKFLLIAAVLTLATIVFLAAEPASVNAETLDECIKKYQSMGVSYDIAKDKCYNLYPIKTPNTIIQSPGTIPTEDFQAPTTQQAIDSCIQKYVDVYKLSYEQAKEKCYGQPVNQTAPVEPKIIQPTPIPPDASDCIKDYMSRTGNTYEDAKEKCAPIVPVYSPPGPIKEMTPFESCAQKYLNSGYTPEEAKKICAQQQPTTTAEPQISPVESCIKKYMDVFNVSYEDAKTKCVGIVNVAQPTATAVQLIKENWNCAELEKRLAELTQKIQTSQGQVSAELMAEISKIKQGLLSCRTNAVQSTTANDPCVQIRKNTFDLETRLKQGVSNEEAAKIKGLVEANKQKLANCAGAQGQAQATPGIKNPCDEVPSLKSALESMLKKEVQLKDLIAQGQVDKTALDDLYRQIEFLKKRLEQMQFACQQGNKPVEESSCSRLAKLELLYSQNQDQSFTKEIIVLKERCRLQDLASEKPETLGDVQEAYKSKLKAVIEGTFGNEQAENLKQTENQKDKLIGEIARKSGELDLRGINIVDKVKIGKGEVALDNIQANPASVKINVNGKEITINPSKAELTEVDDDVSWVVKVDDDVTWLAKDGKLVGENSGKPINIMPSEIKDKVGAEPKSVEFKDEDAPKYEVKIGAKAKLFGFIPVTASRNFEVDAQTGTTRETASWWRFLVRY